MNVHCIMRIPVELHVICDDLILVFLPKRRLLVKFNFLLIVFLVVFFFGDEKTSVDGF